MTAPTIERPPAPAGFAALARLAARTGGVVVDADAPERLLGTASTGAPLVVLARTAPTAEAALADASVAAHVRARAEAGGRVVLAFTPEARERAVTVAGVPGLVVGDLPLWKPDAIDPLVADTLVEASADVAPLLGSALRAIDVTPIHLARREAGTALFRSHGVPVAVEVPVGAGQLVIIGCASLFEDRWLAAADNARFVAWAMTGAVDPEAEREVKELRLDPVVHHAGPWVVDIDPAEVDLSLLPPADTDPGSPEFLLAAARNVRRLPTAAYDALVGFVDHGHRSGGLLLRGLPVGDVPPTPLRPTEAGAKDRVSEFMLLTVARALGQPVGYLPEHGGDVVQNLVPTPGQANAQTSTSSAVELQLHTEAAFHPHRPRFLVLSCLRGDHDGVAATLVSSVTEVVNALPLWVRETLAAPRFRTGIDESFVGRRSGRLGRLLPVLTGDFDNPRFVFDADLMHGVDDEAERALAELGHILRSNVVSVVLHAGELLVVDNSVAVHGRTPFTARFDGTDRWLQRTFVVSDLAASAGERHGRVITTRFGA